MAMKRITSFQAWRVCGAVLLALICAGSPALAMIGGTRVGPDEYVAAVRLTRWEGGFEYTCSGTLITPRHVLTAAHCVPACQDVRIRFGGSLDWDDVEDPVYSPQECHPHEDWNASSQTGKDLMIIELTEEVSNFEYQGQSVEVEPWPILGAVDSDHLGVPIPGTGGRAEHGAWVRHVGYGAAEDSAIGNTKRTRLAKVVAFELGSGFLTDALLRQGDSGGPVIQYRADQEVVVGVVHAETGGQGVAYWIDEDTYEWIHERVDLLEGQLGVELLSSDYDSDGIDNLSDNCLLTRGAGDGRGRDDADSDSDNVGDVCDNCDDPNGGQMDFDGDGVARGCDNCRDRYNPRQGDEDGDGVGNGCDNCPIANPGPRDVQIQADVDRDGLGDACDNCKEDVNPFQANCDAQDDLREGVDADWQGDACDPDLCVEIDGPPRFSEEIAPAGFWAFITRGREVEFNLATWGGEATDDDPPRYLTDYAVAPVRVAYCKCEPNPEDESECLASSDCPTTGEFSGGWRDLTWYGPYGSSGDGVIPDVLFKRPGGAGDNSTSFSWYWSGIMYLPDDAHVRLWLRPAESPEIQDWPPSKGNTYSDLLHLRVSRIRVPWMPPDLRHGSLELGGLLPLPRGIDLTQPHICLPPGPCPWYGLVSQPFELPSLLAASYGFDSPLIESRYALKQSERAALNALAVRHQWTGSGFVSGYMPVEFDSGGQLDLVDFASTVMLEEPGLPGSYSGEGEKEAKDLNDLMSIWTFGGMDRAGRVYAELWRGHLDRSGDLPTYRFAKVKTDEGPQARSGAMLLADLRGQRLMLIGGQSSKGLLDEAWTYDLLTGKWQPQSVTLPRTLGLVEAAWYVAGDHAYIYGGQNKNGKSDALWQLDLGRLQFERLGGDAGQAGPGVRLGASITVDAEKGALYLYGGLSDKGWRNDLYAFDLQTEKWEQLHGQCEPGQNCPPPAMGSALLFSGVADAVTLAIGTPAVKWSGTDHEWRYLVSEQKWVPENLIRTGKEPQ